MTLLPYLATFYLDEEEQHQVRPFSRPAPYRVVNRRTYKKRPLIEAYTKTLLDVVTPILEVVDA